MLPVHFALGSNHDGGHFSVGSAMAKLHLLTVTSVTCASVKISGRLDLSIPCLFMSVIKSLVDKK